MSKEINPPFTKRALKSPLFSWAKELEIAYLVAQEYGCSLMSADDQFVVARIIGDGVRLALYPHRTTALNYHLRVRDEGSKKPRQALYITLELNRRAGFTCTFSMNGQSRAALEKRAAIDEKE